MWPPTPSTPAATTPTNSRPAGSCRGQHALSCSIRASLVSSSATTAAASRPTDLQDIFSLFISQKGSRGTGLGLPVSQKILEGTRRADSRRKRRRSGAARSRWSFPLSSPKRSHQMVPIASATPPTEPTPCSKAPAAHHERRVPVVRRGSPDPACSVCPPRRPVPNHLAAALAPRLQSS